MVLSPSPVGSSSQCSHLDRESRNWNYKKEVCSVVESTNRCLLKPIELPEAFWF